jgi:hypothetical protein
MGVKLGLKHYGKNITLRCISTEWEKVVGGWRRLYNKELHNLHASQNIIRLTKRRMRWAWHVPRMEEMRNAYKILVEKPVGK